MAKRWWFSTEDIFPVKFIDRGVEMLRAYNGKMNEYASHFASIFPFRSI